MVIGPAVCGEVNDIAWELCCSSREASVAFNPFAILDVTKTMWPVTDSRIETERVIDAEQFYRLLDGVAIDDTGLFEQKRQDWENYYNFSRPPWQSRRPDPLRMATREDSV